VAVQDVAAAALVVLLTGCGAAPRGSPAPSASPLSGKRADRAKSERAKDARPKVDRTRQPLRLGHVLDGDSFVGTIDGREVRVRLFAVDAPEGRQAFGDQARSCLRDRLKGVLEVEPHDTDKFDRIVAVVYADGQDVNRRLVEDGCAWWFRSFAPHDDGLRDAEARAKAARRGLWANASPEPPWVWRKAHPRTDARADASR
jgi:endonuclease YncB( thermonuclease family)